MKLIVCFILVHKIAARHQLLVDTLTVRDDETESDNMATYLNNCLTPIFLTALMLEITSFFLYINLVKKYLLFHILLISPFSLILALRITYRTRTIKKDIVPLKDNYFHVLVASLEANNQRRDTGRGDHEMLHVP